MASTHDTEPSYSLESSFYGPGALSCWYLTVITARVITPLLSNPSSSSSSSEKRSTFVSTLEHVASILYPCLSAGHLARQISLFEKNDIAKFADSVASLSFGGARELEIANPDLDPATVKAITGLNAPLRVCAIFLLIWALASVIPLIKVDGDKQPTEDGQPLPEGYEQPRASRPPLGWRILDQIPHVWVIGCILYLVHKCRQSDIAAAMTAMFGVYILHALLCLSFHCFFIWINVKTFLTSPDAWLGPLRRSAEPRKTVIKDSNRSLPGRYYPENLTFHSLLVVTVFIVYGTVVLGFAAAAGYTFWVFRFDYFPDVGVSMSSLDQILALVTGVFTIIFACKERLKQSALAIVLTGSQINRRTRNRDIGPPNTEQVRSVEWTV